MPSRMFGHSSLNQKEVPVFVREHSGGAWSKIDACLANLP